MNVRAHIKNHSKTLLFVSVLYLVFGVVLLVGSLSYFNRHLILGAWFSLFLGFVHFFIAWGIWHKKKWAPYLGMLFELYLLFNFFMYSLPLIHERITLVAPISYGMIIFISIVPILLLIAFIMTAFIIRKEHFTK